MLHNNTALSFAFIFITIDDRILNVKNFCVKLLKL